MPSRRTVFLWVKDLNLKAESVFGAWWVISALGLQLAQSGQIPLLCPSCCWSSPHTFRLLPDSPPPPLAWTKTSPPLEPIQKSPMNLTHLLTSGYQDMCLSQTFLYTCLWGHWVWEREKGCRSGVSVVVAVLVCLVMSGVNEHDNTLQRYIHVHSSQTRQDTASSVFEAVLDM